MKPRFVLFRAAIILACALFLGGLGVAAAPPVRARADEARAARARLVIHPNASLGAFDDRLLGSNLAMWLGDHLYDETFRARTRASGVRVLRIPGGSMSDHFGWLSCEMRADQTNAHPCYDTWEQWAARPTDFINFIKAVGIAKVIYTMNVNVTPQEAAAAVAFFNAQPSNTTHIGVDANGFDWKTAGDWAQLRLNNGNVQPLHIADWEIGNEVYGGDPALGGADCVAWGWENSWTCDGVEYVNGAKGYAGYTALRDAMRAIDPSIRVGAVGMEAPNDYANWGNEVIANAGSFMDYYIIHPYAYFDLPANDAAGWAEMLAKPRAFIPQIKSELQAAFDAHANGRAIPIAATEYNIVSVQEQDNAQLMNRHLDALFIAEMLGQFAAHGYWAANQWDLTNGCAGNGTCYDLIQVDHAWKRSPQYYAFVLWSRFGSEMLALDNSRDPVTQLSAYAGRIDADTYSLLVINKTANEYRTRITFDNGAVVTDGAADVLQAKSPKAKRVRLNGNANPANDLSDAPSLPLTTVGAVTRYTFAPYSITLLRLNAP